MGILLFLLFYGIIKFAFKAFGLENVEAIKAQQIEA